MRCEKFVSDVNFKTVTTVHTREEVRKSLIGVDTSVNSQKWPEWEP